MCSPPLCCILGYRGGPGICGPALGSGWTREDSGSAPTATAGQTYLPVCVCVVCVLCVCMQGEQILAARVYVRRKVQIRTILG